MPPIGDTLREARMRRDIDVSEVESRTKIRAKYLRALENEEFASLPGPTYVRSFLRTYADFLGLDGGLLVEEYRAHHEPPDDTELQFGSPSPQRARERAGGGGVPRGGPRIGPPSPLAVLGTVVVLIVAILLVVGLAGDGGEGGDEGEGGDQAVSTRDEARQDARERRVARRRAAARQRARRRAAARRRRVEVRIVPVDATYVCVDDGEDRVIFEGTLSQPQTFRGRQVRVNLGKRSAELRHNGRRVQFEEGPDPVGFDFRAGERPDELPQEQRPCA